MNKITHAMSWLASRVVVAYVIAFLFCVSTMDLKNLEMRTKVRHLNDAIPDFSNIIIFSYDPNSPRNIDWKPYKNYFELILRYMPEDIITKQLLGFVDYYRGHEQEAIDLFKSSSVADGKPVFWSNYNLGVIYYKKKMWPQAAEYSFKAVAASIRKAGLQMQRSLLYKQISANIYFKTDMGEGLKDAQSRACIMLLSSLYHMRQYDKIIVISNLALANHSMIYKDAFYYYEALSFFDMGRMKEAFMLLQKSLTIERSNPDVYYYIADIYQQAGVLEKAQDLMQQSLILHQKNDPRFPYEAHINLRFF